MKDSKCFTDFMVRGSGSWTAVTKGFHLKDGTTLSIQASDGHYSTPRADLSYNQYTEFEIGFPSKVFESILPYAEDPTEPTGTFYCYVPKEIIQDLIDSCGGVELLLQSENS